ncbi:MAG: DUF4838 domain-containing protein [Clostridia bacterium]|nr:DUF4838 domain-containing protein [Clostridia bacterium]
MKRKISVLLSAIMIASAIAGCAPAKDAASVTTSGNLSVYADWLTDRLESDGKLTADTEIIIGNAAEAESYGVDVSSLSDEGFIIRRAAGETSTLIFGKTDNAVDMAVRYYANYCSVEGELNVVEGEGYRVGSITIAGADLSEYVIVCPEDADESQKFAADELRRFLGDACGIYPEIVTETGGYAITLVCDTTGEAYGDEAFNVKSHEKGITITGGRWRGCMYGVYDFLEECIGYRFYYRNIAAKGEIEAADVYLYEAESVVLGTDIDHTEHPSIPVRDTYGSGTSSPALKYNGERFRGNAKYGGYGGIVKACHGYIGYISDAELHEMGYYAGYDYGINPCYTSEELNELLIERILENCRYRVSRGAVPGKDFTTVDIAQHDIGTFCTCEDCVDIYSKYGGVAGATVNLANMVAEALEPEFPELAVGILAYYGSDVPPRNITIHENVYISYCFYVSLNGYFECGNHSINGSECSTNKYFAELYDGWAELTDNLYVWYYPFQAYYLAYSSPYTFNIYKDIKYLAECNTYGIFLHGEGDSINQTYNTGLINFYMAQRMMWNADITEEEYHEVLKEYLWLAYGDGYEFVYDYITIMEEAADRKGCFCGFHSAFMAKLDMSYLKSNMDLLLELRENAIKYARNSEQEMLCDRLFASVLYYELAVFHNDMWVNGDDTSKSEYKEKLEYFLTNYRSFPIGEYSLGTPSYPPALSEVDFDQNPLEWVPDRLGGWDYNYDF